MQSIDLKETYTYSYKQKKVKKQVIKCNNIIKQWKNH